MELDVDSMIGRVVPSAEWLTVRERVVEIVPRAEPGFSNVPPLDDANEPQDDEVTDEPTD